jgi:hypothetical protein
MPPAYNPYGSPYFNLGNLYGSDVDYSTAPIVGGPGGYLANTPQAAYTRITSPYGGGVDRFSKFVQGEYPRVLAGLQAARATNPNVTFGYGDPRQDYGRQLTESFFRNLWNQQSAEQRGINAPRFGGGRVQWQRQFL